MSRAHPFTVFAVSCLTLVLSVPVVQAQNGPAPAAPSMVDGKLNVDPVIEGLLTPISIAFLEDGDLFVLEKNTGIVRHIVDGVDQGVVLDLAVNFGSERGLLGIALHPDFPTNPSVYLFSTCRTTVSPIDPFNPSESICTGPPQLGGPDTDMLDQVPLLANRVDRYTWNGSTLTWQQNLITLRAFQADGAPTPPNQGDAVQPARGNHNGGVLRFGPDRKLYVLFGDQGRRGQLQNLPSGPTATGLGPTVPDDQFGGPTPDNAHFSGVILRLNPDGTTPTDNPFYSAGGAIGGEAGENIRKIYAYGLRNSFGMAFDPVDGALWDEENGEDAFDEINRVTPGMNGGWIQVAGPLSRIDQFRQIETTSTHGGDTPGPNLQQLRWPPENIALTEAEAVSRMFELPGSAYSNPEFSWKHVIAPAALGFIDGRALGAQYDGDMVVGLSVPLPEGGPLLRLQLTGNRRQIASDDSRLADHVADNLTFNELTESESLLWGRNFGVVTDIQTGPNGNLYVVSLTNGAIYEISGPTRPQQARGNPHNPKPGNPNPGSNGNNGNHYGQDKNGNNGNGNNAQHGNHRGGKPHSGEEAVAAAVAPAPLSVSTAGTRSIRFALESAERVRLTLHDVSGRLVARVMESDLPAGSHEFAWPAGVTEPGMYFVRLELLGEGASAVRTAKAVVTR